MVANLKEIQKVNQHPLNQHAKNLLKQVKDYPQEHQIYLIQLLDWAAREGLVELEAPRYSLDRVLELALEANNPQKIAKVLKLDQMSKLENPVDQAEEVAQRLHELMLEEVV
jgi:translation initiation factor 2 alpha subunit (eIF-2alpha)